MRPAAPKAALPGAQVPVGNLIPSGKKVPEADSGAYRPFLSRLLDRAEIAVEVTQDGRVRVHGGEGLAPVEVEALRSQREQIRALYAQPEPEPAPVPVPEPEPAPSLGWEAAPRPQRSKIGLPPWRRGDSTPTLVTTTRSGVRIYNDFD